VYSTYLGGNGTELAQGMAIDRCGDAYVSGTTGSIDFPSVRAVQSGFGGGPNDAFVAKISDRRDRGDDNGDEDDAEDNDENGNLSAEGTQPHSGHTPHARCGGKDRR